MNFRLKQIIRNKFNFRNSVINKLISGMMWNLTGTILSKVFMMMSLIIVARILGVDKNGEYCVINSTVLMFSTFAGLGLGTTATRFVAEYKEKDKMKCGRIIGLINLLGLGSGSCMAIILVILARWLAREQLNALHLTPALMISSVLLITNTINSIQTSVLSGFENFKAIAKLTITQGLISFPTVVIFTYLFDVVGLILGNILVGCVMTVLNGIENYKVRKECNVHMDFHNIGHEMDILWRFSLPAMLSNIMVGPLTWVGNTFITATKNGYFELGIFNAANQWRTVLTFLPSTVGTVILPLIIANKGNDRLERINILFGWMIVIFFAIPILSAPELVTWLYGSKYMGQSLNLSLLMVIFTCCILSYTDGITRNLVTNNMMWWGFLNNTLWGGTFLGILWWIRDMGAIGLSLAYLIAYFLTTLVFVPFYIKKKVVSKTLLVSKEVVLIWVVLFSQMIGTVMSLNFEVRAIICTLSMMALWRNGKVLVNSSPLT